jgi:hypothetical protein
MAPHAAFLWLALAAPLAAAATVRPGQHAVFGVLVYSRSRYVERTGRS